MFTYREFADGAHRYRQQIARESRPDRDLDYEAARAENELAVISLSRSSDPEDLAVIYTHLDALMNSLEGGEQETSYEDCVKLSALFTYYKVIAQRCGLALTMFDYIYADAKIDWKYSSGGLIYTMRPRPEYWVSLPRVRAKVPITATLGKIRTIIHEVFVAMVALNPLRRSIPSFIFVYSYWQCGSMIDTEKSFLSGLCATEGTRPMMVYENTPGAYTLFEVLRDNKDTPLSSILSYLLQLMGALQMANDYADYTHYDLHSGNVLVQQLSEPAAIGFQDYLIGFQERIIIIDNGLAYCRYSKRKRDLPNSGSVEFFASEGPEIERLMTTRMEGYGSIQNQVLGVYHDRPYPLGDVFRIFFDIYSLCVPETQSQLQPLVSHFFSDPDISSRLAGSTEHASSMVNAFSLPPFKAEMFNYSYRDFSRVIIENYWDIVKRFAQRHEQPLLSPLAVKLEDAFDWRTPDAAYSPDLYEIGITAILSEEKARTLIKRSRLRTTQEDVLRRLAILQRDMRAIITSDNWHSIKEYNTSSFGPATLNDYQFYSKYVSNMNRVVDRVQRVRIVYTNVRVLAYALGITGVPDPLTLLSQTLGVRVQALDSLAFYCATAVPNQRAKDMFREMTQLTDRIERSTSKDVSPRQNHCINWYRACLPSVRLHLEFCMEWGGRPATFGELSLPPIVEN